MDSRVLTQMGFTEEIQCSTEKIKEKVKSVKEEFHLGSKDYFDSVLGKSSSAFKDSAVGIFLMRELLLKLGADLKTIEIKRNSDGRPCIQDSEFDFNIAHSDGFVICGAIKGGVIGCDIQAERNIDAEKRDRLIHRFMSGAEIRQYGGEPDRNGFYFSAWAKKESVIKCFGGRVWDDLRELPYDGVYSSSVINGGRRAFWAVCHKFYSDLQR